MGSKKGAISIAPFLLPSRNIKNNTTGYFTMPLTLYRSLALL